MLINLPGTGGYAVIKEQIIQKVLFTNSAPDPDIEILLKNTHQRYERVHIPYPLDVGEWYQVKKVCYPNRGSIAYQPWITLGLNRSKRKWVRQKVNTIVQEELKKNKYYGHTDVIIRSINIHVPASSLNGKMYYTSSEDEAIKLSNQYLNLKSQEPDPTKQRWISLLKE